MQVSIIIINYKTEALIINCLRSVYTYTKTLDFEVIVIDNAYTSEGEALVKQEFPTITWLDMGYNAGFARANNAGMAVAKGKYFLLLNADTLLIDNAIEKAFERLEADSNLAAIGGIQLYEDGSPMPYYPTSNDIRRTFFIFPNRPIFEKLIDSLLPKYQFDSANETDYLVGAFIMTRASVVAKVGGLDEDFFMYGEDNEWSGRLMQAGKLRYFPDIRFIHLVNDSPFRRENISYVNRFSTQMQVSNLVWIRKKFGILPYLTILLNYIILIPTYFPWLILSNIIRLRSPILIVNILRIFVKKTFVLLKYSYRTLRNRPYFYKLKPQENIR